MRSWLERRGLALLPVSPAKRDTHPVWIDLGRIVRGAAQAVGIDQHTWWSRTGEAVGGTLGFASGVAVGSGLGATAESARMAYLGSRLGPLGSVWGAAIGWFGGAAAGAAAFAARGARSGSGVAAGLARELSQGASEVLGTYLETIVAIPNVTVNGGRKGPYLYVLGMHTNGAVAVWGDRTLRYGYGKRFLEISASAFESYEVREPSGASLLRAELSTPHAASWQRPAALVGIRKVASLLSQPLLGQLEGDLFALSYLERSYPNDLECVAPASGQLQVAATFAEGLPGGDYRLEALGRSHVYGAFSARGVATRVTYPEHRRRNEL